MLTPFAILNALTLIPPGAIAVPSLVGVALTLIGIFTLSVLVLIVALSRHKKSCSGRVELPGVKGHAHGVLDPEGFVIVNGDLWPAISVNAHKILDGEMVCVMGADSIRLGVSRLSDQAEI